MKIIITTTQSGVIANEESFNKFVRESGFDFVPRNRRGIKSLTDEANAAAVMVWEDRGPVLYMQEEKFFFHPSMAKNRLAAFRKQNNIDIMVRACDIKPGDDFLDCTLGLGADAIVASYFGFPGRVVGLEVSPGIYQVVKWGMKLYSSRMQWLDKAVKHIEVLNCDHYSYLKQLPDDSFDIVYFDPMFRKPVLHSQAIAPLRKMADHSPLNSAIIAQACRVARKRVVMKELIESGEIQRLGFDLAPGSKHNRIGYGIISV